MSVFVVTVSSIIAWANYHNEPLPPQTKANLVVIEKSKRLLSLYSGNTLLKKYKVSLGRVPLGHKIREGDYRTPEGLYRIDYRKSDSGYHKALHISYPNETDIKAARRQGVSPGGAIMVHGMRNGFGWVGNMHQLVDWTAGCIAVTNWEIDEIWQAVPDGTSIEIKP